MRISEQPYAALRERYAACEAAIRELEEEERKYGGPGPWVPWRVRSELGYQRVHREQLRGWAFRARSREIAALGIGRTYYMPKAELTRARVRGAGENVVFC
jgi:hypothetical protein